MFAGRSRSSPAYGRPRAGRGTNHPLVDVGCGIGLLPLYLRASGFQAPIVGIDHDERKIAVALSANAGGVTFILRDLRAPFDVRANVALLDVLHYFTDADQRVILSNAGNAVPPGAVLVIRDGVRDGSLQYRMTYLLEAFARRNGWLRAERLNFPTRQSIMEVPDGNFRAQSRRLSGPLPLNNYLFVFRRSGGDLPSVLNE